jgi:hypothetical protein
LTIITIHLIDTRLRQIQIFSLLELFYTPEDRRDI